jgi:cytochrome c oxidase cbb3-type subunit 3
MLNMRRKFMYTVAFLLGGLLLTSSRVLAAGPPAPSPFSNPMALTLMILMLLLLIIIGVLANILVGAAKVKMSKKKAASGTASPAAAVLTMFLLLAGSSLFAQDVSTPTQTAGVAKNIGGLSPSTFYIMAAVLFIELSVILVLVVNIKFLLKAEVIKLAETFPLAVKKPMQSWWNRLNKFKPVEQEADIDLGHEYDGIRELDNRLPPWWIYGFYLTIVFAGIYLWRFHVSHTGPSSVEEYERSVAKAETRIKEYLKQKGEAIDENTVSFLSSSNDLSEGKIIYMKSCAACHKDAGGGDVGPNLTDEYWLHGGDVKSIFKVIRYGYNAMPQWQNTYSNKQIAQVASYIKSLKGTNPPNPKAPQGEVFKEAGAAPVVDSAAMKDPKIARQ